MDKDENFIVQFKVIHEDLHDKEHCVMVVKHNYFPNDPFEMTLTTYRNSSSAPSDPVQVIMRSRPVGQCSFPLIKSDLPEDLLAGLAARNKAACEKVLDMWNNKAGDYALKGASVDI